MIRVSHLNKTYDRRSRAASQALYDVSFTLPDTGFVCIVGPSGCGKTSLLNAIGGLDLFESGTISTDRLEQFRCGARSAEEERNRSFGYIFQNYYLLPEYSAAYNVWLGLHSLDLSRREKLSRVMEALKAVDMDRYARRAVGELSGGQQQRVAIARALARRPRVIFADEPTGNLDEANTMNICALLRRISRTSLVVMVTHEERIARFFADRIITLEDGRLKADQEGWQRDEMCADTASFYTGDHQESRVLEEGLTLRLLREEGAPPADVTLVLRKDRILIKLDDARTVTCTRSGEAPLLVEGPRPVLRLQELDQDDSIPLLEEAPQKHAGSALTFPVLLSEARRLLQQKGARRLGTWFFLVALTVMTLLAVGDYLEVASIDPEDFITSDSHMLEITVDRASADGSALGLQDLAACYREHLDASGLDFDYVPRIPTAAQYTVGVFLQMGNLSEPLSGFSYVPLDRLDESTLIYGRMPERPDEIVVDRWVLDSLMERDGIIQSGLHSVTDFLDARLDYAKKNYAPTIVGICDGGEPAVYMAPSALASLGTLGVEVITLSELKALFPGRYDGVSLGDEECLVITNNAGIGYADRVGGVYSTGGMRMYTIRDVIEEEGTYALLVIADEEVDALLRSMMTAHFYLYCADKAAMKDYIARGLPEDLDEQILAEVTDAHDDAWASYRSATRMRLDSRRIVTLTVILLSLSMLYLLQRSQVQERIGMAAVYRLLGIPGRKLSAIFALESLLLSLISALPAAALTWLIVAFLSRMPSLDIPLLLPWYAAILGWLFILVFHILVSVAPLRRLLRLPPARLAAKYDL